MSDITLGEMIILPFWADECLDHGEGRCSLIKPAVTAAFGHCVGLLVGEKSETTGSRSAAIAAFDGGLNPATETRFTHRLLDDGECTRIAVQGGLREDQRRALQPLLAALKAQPTKAFEIDLMLCDHITVTGVAMLLLIKEEAGASKEHMLLKHCNSEVIDTLLWAGMEQYFTIDGLEK